MRLADRKWPIKVNTGREDISSQIANHKSKIGDESAGCILIWSSTDPATY